MSQIVVSDNFEQQFAGVTSMTEVRDKDGHLLGHFVPTQNGATLAQLQPEITEAEIRRRIAAGGGRPLTQILRDLGTQE